MIATVIRHMALYFPLAALVAPILFILSPEAQGHGGGIDRCGGHNDRKKGEYHIHQIYKYCKCHPDAKICKDISSDR